MTMKPIFIFRVIFISLLAFALTACGGFGQNRNDPRDVSFQTRTTVVVADNEMTKDCSISSPIAKSQYLGLDFQSKEAALSSYVRSLLGDLNKCNKQWKTLREWNATEKKRYESVVPEKN